MRAISKPTLSPIRYRALVLGVCSGVALSLSGVALAAEQAVAAPAVSTEAEPPAVIAAGDAPAVPAAVTTVEAPYSLPTSTPTQGDAATGRAKTITMDEALHGTAWTANTMIVGNCTPTDKPGGDGLSASAQEVMDCIAEVYPQIGTYYGVGHRSANSKSDHPRGLAVDAMVDDWDTSEGNALGWDIAHFVADNARALNVKYVIFDGQIYIPGSGWRGYHHPSGATDANSMHLNHVHVSVRS